MPRGTWSDRGEYRQPDYLADPAEYWDRADRGRPPQPRSWDGPGSERSDRDLWAIIADRLEADGNLDLREVEMTVRDAEVTLNGRVEFKDQKRRIEDLADVRGVTHVQNNLRVRHRSHWAFI